MGRSFLLLMALLALPAVDLVPHFAAARVGDLLEWDLRGAEAAWLTTDVRATPVLTVTAPDGTTHARTAYRSQDGRRAPGGSGD